MRKIFITIVLAFITLTIPMWAQEKKQDVEGTKKKSLQVFTETDTIVTKTQLVKKYDSEMKTIEGLINKRVKELAEADAIYNQLLGMKSGYLKLIKEINATPLKK